MYIYLFFISIIVSFFLINSILHFARKKIFRHALTIIVWTVVLMFALFPSYAKTISVSLGMGENLNTLIFSGFLFVLLIIFHILKKIESMRSEISEIVRTDALEKFKDSQIWRIK